MLLHFIPLLLHFASAQSFTNSSTSASSSTSSSSNGAGAGAAGTSLTSQTTISTLTYPVTTFINGQTTVVAASVGVQVVIVLDGQNTVSQSTLTISPGPVPLSTLYITSGSADASPTSRSAGPGAVLSTSSVVVIVDSHGDPVTPGGAVSDQRRTTTSQIIITMFPSPTASAGPQLAGVSRGSSIRVAVVGLLSCMALSLLMVA